MSRHLVEWLLQHPVELPPVENVGADRAWRVLMHLADRTHEQTGLMYASDRDQERCSGLNRRAVIQPVRAALEQAGWLVPTGRRRARGVREFTLQVPGYAYPASGSAHLATENDQDRTSGSVSGSVSGSGSGSGGLAKTEPNRTPPYPPTATDQVNTDAAGAGGVSVQAIVRQCEQVRRATFTGTDRGGLAQHWAKTDRPNAVQAMRENPGADLDTLVTATLALADNYQGPATAPRTAPRAPVGPQAVPDCPDCNGLGVVRTWQDSAQDYANHWCSCTQTPTQEPTQESVSVSSAPNANSTGPGAQADPQSLVRDLSRRLRAVP